MTRLHFWIFVGMVMFFAAGFVGGVTSSRVKTQSVTRGGGGGPPEPHMFRELNLTDEQREKLRPIWEGLMRNAPPPPSPEEFDKIQQDFQKKVNDLFTPEQQERYKQLQAEYESQMAALRKDVEGIFKEADAKTRAILTPEQQKKFDEIRSRVHHGPPMFGGGPGSYPGGGPNRGPGGPDHGPDGPGHGPGGPGPDPGTNGGYRDDKH